MTFTEHLGLTLKTYSKHFGKDNINILFFEDFINNRNFFLKEIGRLLSLKEKTIKRNFMWVHHKRKKKTSNAYIVESPQNLKLLDLSYKIKIKTLKSLHNKIKQAYGESNIITSFFRKIILRNREIEIPQPTKKEKEIILNIFRENNLKLIEEFNLDKTKLHRYNYI